MPLKQLEKAGIIPVITIDRIADAMPVADALERGGLQLAEITFRSEVAAEVIKKITSAKPNFLVGAGTLLTPESVDAAKAAGARFGVAPGLNPRVVKHAMEIDFPFYPGVCTPTDVEAALELGCRTLKFFPAEASGGVKMLNALYGPYKHLGLRFIPTGGMKLESVPDYLPLPSVVAIGGTWIAPNDFINEQDWHEIEQRAIAASHRITHLERE
jgi:2-dehydro-3-deoxyphosphogluconate aldolase / (4S)-4-hydroxy-2-oxoglutarate aldolase